MKNLLLGISAISIFLSFASIQVNLVLSFACLMITALSFRELILEIESENKSSIPSRGSDLVVPKADDNFEISAKEIDWNSMAKKLIASNSNETPFIHELLDESELEFSDEDNSDKYNWASILELKENKTQQSSLSSLQSLEHSLVSVDLNQEPTLLVTDLNFGQEGHLSLASLITKKVSISKVLCKKIFGQADLIPQLGNLTNINLDDITNFFLKFENQYSHIYFLLSDSQVIQWEPVIRRLNSSRLVVEVEIQDNHQSTNIHL